MLRVEKLSAYYGATQILHDIDMFVESGEIVGLVGANAAGKSTLMYSLSGLRTRCTGSISIDGRRIDALQADQRVPLGLVLVPERRRLFPFMTVLENLEIGAYSAALVALPFLAPLPRLAERRDQEAGSLSGGEQQMVALGRALMARPRILLLDEPTEGLAPIFVNLVYDLVRALRALEQTVLIVEQNVQHVLRTADRAYVLENGRITMHGTGEELLGNERLKVAYLGL